SLRRALREAEAARSFWREKVGWSARRGGRAGLGREAEGALGRARRGGRRGRARRRGTAAAGTAEREAPIGEDVDGGAPRVIARRRVRAPRARVRLRYCGRCHARDHVRSRAPVSVSVPVPSFAPEHALTDRLPSSPRNRHLETTSFDVII